MSKGAEWHIIFLADTPKRMTQTSTPGLTPGPLLKGAEWHAIFFVGTPKGMILRLTPGRPLCQGSTVGLTSIVSIGQKIGTDRILTSAMKVNPCTGDDPRIDPYDGKTLQWLIFQSILVIFNANLKLSNGYKPIQISLQYPLKI